MAPLRTTKRFSHNTATKHDSKAVNRQDDAESEELTDPGVNTDSTDGEDQSQRDEPEETQSKSAQDLLSSMVAGVSSRPPCLPRLLLCNVLMGSSGTQAPHSQEEKRDRILCHYYQRR
jgi:hypothetical protein